MKNHHTPWNIFCLLTCPVAVSPGDNEIWDKEGFGLRSVSSHLTEPCSRGHNTDSSLCRKIWTVHLGSSHFSSRWHLSQSITPSASRVLLKSAYSSKNPFFFVWRCCTSIYSDFSSNSCSPYVWFRIFFLPVDFIWIGFGFSYDQCLGHQSAAPNRALGQERVEK